MNNPIIYNFIRLNDPEIWECVAYVCKDSSHLTDEKKELIYIIQISRENPRQYPAFIDRYVFTMNKPK